MIDERLQSARGWATIWFVALCVVSGLWLISVFFGHPRTYDNGFADAECAHQCQGADWVRDGDRCACGSWETMP